MKLTIAPSTSGFAVDGVWRKIDLSALVGTINMVQFDTIEGKGEVEHESTGNEAITSFAQFQSYYDAWVDITPPALPELTYSEKRQAEYPTIAELTVALYDTSDKAALVAKRAAVKLKYPKPE